MTRFRDVNDVIEHLISIEVPFHIDQIGPGDDAIHVDVTAADLGAAEAYFAAHPLALDDGTPVPVSLRPRRSESFVSPPAGTAGRPSDALDRESLVGLDVDEATRRANEAGWLVRAMEPEAIITLELNPERLNLVYDEDRVVTRVRWG